MQGEMLDPLGNPWVVGDEGPALSRRDVLRGVEGVGGDVAERPHLAPTPFGADRMGGVLDDEQAVTVSDLVQPVEVDAGAPPGAPA